jgi:hypothetical protein
LFQLTQKRLLSAAVVGIACASLPLGCKKEKESLILVDISTETVPPETLVSLTLSGGGRDATFRLENSLPSDVTLAPVYGLYVDTTGKVTVKATARPNASSCDGFSGSASATLGEPGDTARTSIRLKQVNLCGGADGGSDGGNQPVCTGTAPPAGVPPALTCCTEYDHADLTGGSTCDDLTRIYTVAFSPDGSKVITGGDDGRVVFWTYDGTKLVRESGGHYVSGAGYGIAAFSPDGTLVAIGGNGVIDIYYLTGTKAWTMAAEATVDGSIYGLGWTPDGQQIVSLDGGANLYIHALTGGAPLFRAAVPVSGPWGLAVAPVAVNGLLGVVVLDADGLSQVYGVTSQGIGSPTTIDTNQEAIWAGCFSPDGKTFVLGETDAFARFYNFPPTSTSPTGTDITIGNDDDIYACAFSPNGSYVALAGGFSQGSVSVWSTSGRTMTSRYNFVDNRFGGLSVAFSPTGNAILVGGTDCGKVLLCRE